MNANKGKKSAIEVLEQAFIRQQHLAKPQRSLIRPPAQARSPKTKSSKQNKRLLQCKKLCE
jgi:hypothetical protein